MTRAPKPRTDLVRCAAIIHDWTCGCGKGQACPNRGDCREAAEQIIAEVVPLAEVERLRAEVEQLCVIDEQQRARMNIHDPDTCGMAEARIHNLQSKVKRLKRELEDQIGEIGAENERLRIEVEHWKQIAWDDANKHMAEVERLRKALERIAETRDVDVNGEYVKRSEPIQGYRAHSIARAALDREGNDE